MRLGIIPLSLPGNVEKRKIFLETAVMSRKKMDFYVDFQASPAIAGPKISIDSPFNFG
jgi:hypothetical protein